MKSKIFSLLKIVFGWPLSLIALLFVGKLIFPQLHNFSFIFGKTNIWFLIASFLFFFFYFLTRSFFWKTVLELSGNKDHSFKSAAYLWELSELKRFIPGNIWSFVGRTTVFATEKISKKKILSLMALEGEFILLGTGVGALPFLYTYLIPKAPQFLIFLMTIGIIIAVLLFLSNRKYSKRIHPAVRLLFPQFSFTQNSILLVIAVVAFSFFSIGTYFAISSLFLLPVNNFFFFTGLFSFALFGGYISLITPMGLGVREVIITAYLSPFLPVQIAAIAALFSRVALVISELLFAGVLWCWVHIKNKTVIKLETWIVRHKFEVSLFIFTALYIGYYTIASFLRYTNFYTGRFDLGNMDQTVWNSIHGRIFQFTNPDGTNIISRLSFHADFILILLAPFYLIWRDPRMLLLIQTIVLALGAFFVYKISQKVINKKPLSLLFAFCYLLNPSLGFSNLYDFHAVTLATTFFLGAWYFLSERKYLWYLLFLFLAAITKEQVWIITALFGIFTFFKYNKKLGITIFFFSIVAAISIFTAITKLHGGQHFALAYYSDYGTSSTGIAKTLISSPLKTLGILFSGNRIAYLVALFFPLGFIAIFSPFILLFAVPDLLLNMLSSTPNLHEIFYQYTAVITPFLFIAAIYGYRFIVKLFPKFQVVVGVYLLLSALLAQYIYGPLPFTKNPNTDMFTKPLTNATVVDDFLDFIPARYSIAATNNIGSHLSHRQKIFTIPTGIDEADVVIFLLNDKFAQPSLSAQRTLAKKLENDPAYVELFKDGDFVAFAKKSLNFQKRLRKEVRYLPILRTLFPRK